MTGRGTGETTDGHHCRTSAARTEAGVIASRQSNRWQLITRNVAVCGVHGGVTWGRMGVKDAADGKFGGKRGF